MPGRTFGRYALLHLLGKSDATMAWLASDPTLEAQVMLVMPRVQPADAAALAEWLDQARRAARLDHPNLARALEVGAHERWPYVAVARSEGFTLAEYLTTRSEPIPGEAAGWLCDVLQGLAYAHDAGFAHGDVEPYSVLIDERGAVRLMGVAAGHRAATPASAGAAPPASRAAERGMALDLRALRAQRDAAALDVLQCGLLLHGWLAGRPALEEPDIGRAAAHLPPVGRELVRLPWTTPLPIPEALRAIVNRATAGQERLRYQNARTLLGALSGWRESEAGEDGGPMALLLDRLGSVGHLPALPGLAARVARITSLEGQRTDQIAAEVLEDTALAFELLRRLNSADVQGTQVQGNGPVLTLRRIVALIGVDGVRLAANSLRQWPGPLADDAARDLQRTLDQARLAGHTAEALRPAGYDAQVVYLIAVLQNLGRLMVRYHFADEALQIDQLMAASSAQDGAAPTAGFDAAAATYAVLGVDIETLGMEVARHWGLDDDVVHMIRRLPLEAPVRKPDSDSDTLRIVASAANEAVDALSGAPRSALAAALAQVARRYARALGVTTRDLHDALLAAQGVLKRRSDAG